MNDKNKILLLKRDVKLIAEQGSSILKHTNRSTTQLPFCCIFFCSQHAHRSYHWKASQETHP